MLSIFDLYFDPYHITVLLTPWLEIEQALVKKLLNYNFLLDPFLALRAKPLHSLFYSNGVKIIPEDIYNMLTPAAFAHLIMGDGSVQRHGLIICTNSYSLEYVVRFMNVLMVRYRLECNLRLKRRQNNKIEHTIYISQSSIPLLRTIVTPYFHPSMLYKLGGLRPIKKLT
jgi:hypothetical protein